ncbi:MAG: serine/threonine protein kinase [Myxococcales bacterium]|nr:serine/threonine protein kinase [Myxococcales bacterium]
MDRDDDAVDGAGLGPGEPEQERRQPRGQADVLERAGHRPGQASIVCGYIHGGILSCPSRAMADPLAPTVPETPRRDDARADGAAATPRADGAAATQRAGDLAAAAPTERADHARAQATPSTVGHGHPVRAAPMADPLERALAKAKAAAALFGDVAAVQVGRYRLIERAGAGGMGVVWSAWDPDLNRGVALKLASAGDDDARARARDEGRALARLSHPNVVPIYDVFEAREGVFLVMELVKGKTLRTVATDGASVPELVRAYRQCGDGLAAAHRAGLVHRDFKPDNAILGADGRVRVLDFGLAREATDELGEIAGTPRYMAPEQRSGLALTAAVDQYALGVALREAVAARGPVPRWLEPILTRATAATADARFPSMDALLAALALDPATRWRRRALYGGGVVALGAVAAAFTLGRANQAPEPCQGSAGAIAASWGGARRTAANSHLAALTGGYTRESVPRIIGALDRYASDWASIHRASCQAHQRRELSEPAYDRRTACLARRKTALATLGELAGRAAIDALPGLVIAVGGLPELATCEDDDALASPVAPPTPAQADEADAIADLIARVDVERDAADTDAATRDADAAVARAEALGYVPLVARALLASGRITLAQSRDDRGGARFTEATRLALEVGDEPLAIEAYARAAYAIATTAGPARATDGLPLIEAITRRLDDRAAFPRALLHHNVGTVELARGDRAAARAAFERARADSAGLTGSAAIEMSVGLMSLLVITDDEAAQAQLGRALVETRSRLLGANHPSTLDARAVVGELIADPDAAWTALAPVCDALVALHPHLGGSIGECDHELLIIAAGRFDVAAVNRLARQVEAASAHGADDQHVATARAYALAGDGPDARGLAAFVAARPEITPTSPWWIVLYAADLDLGGAFAALRADQPERARRLIDAASALLDRLTASAPRPIIARRRWALAALRART